MDATSWARDLLGAVPVHRTMGLEVVAAVAGLAEVAIETQPPVANAIGSLHASGLITLVDAGGLAAIISVAERPSQLRGLLPLGAVAHLDFLAPARGRVTGRCSLSTAAYNTARRVISGQDPKGRLETTTAVTDSSGVTVCTGTFTWSLALAP